ncbi:hypothetical protein scyTo_0012256, partial [Scyliorhinus torazame]|nr:hypothetical protein [Scyliorhinus torazame]
AQPTAHAGLLSRSEFGSLPCSLGSPARIVRLLGVWRPGPEFEHLQRGAGGAIERMAGLFNSSSSFVKFQ